ncbi:MAG: hypothetical protein H0T73_19985 [Ardenticatenales bacterium]|nr:hypothetical protein [Ardenticatenales bacterium]
MSFVSQSGCACERLAEFPHSHSLTPKGQAYCDHCIIYLGGGKDDGLTIPPYLSYHFDYPQLATTLRRFLALAEAQGWRSLVVQALGETVEGLQDSAESLPGARTFCVLLCWPEPWRPDVVGLATPLLGALP